MTIEEYIGGMFYECNLAREAMRLNDLEMRASLMLPPPPVDPPSYDLALIDLPKLEPTPEETKNARSTKRLGLWHRVSAIWCRANGDDHSQRVRRGLDNLIARLRGGNHE
ncbi:MAG: hypothetical protein V4457_11760 [Pseudomonadota bacterium]